MVHGVLVCTVYVCVIAIVLLYLPCRTCLMDSRAPVQGALQGERVKQTSTTAFLNPVPMEGDVM